MDDRTIKLLADGETLQDQHCLLSVEAITCGVAALAVLAVSGFAGWPAWPGIVVTTAYRLWRHFRRWRAIEDAKRALLATIHQADNGPATKARPAVWL